MNLKRIVSGGQTGADQAGLFAGKALGIPTGGFMPKGWLTEEGPRPELKELFGMEEASGSNYRTRTMWNVRTTDCTLIFGDETSQGSALTITHCKERGKPYLVVPFPTSFSPDTTAKIVRTWLAEKNPEYLNIAGNRESKNPGIFEFTLLVLVGALGLEPHCSHPDCYKPGPPF